MIFRSSLARVVAAPLLSPLLVAGLALSVASPPAAAQSLAASESTFVPAHGVVAGGGQCESVFGSSLETTIGQPLSGERAASTNYILESAVAWVIDPPQSALVVAGVRPGNGDKAGGDSARIFGYGFAEPGAGALDVLFPSGPAGAVQVLSNLEASAVTPSGMDDITNPIAEVDVVASNDFGGYLVQRGYNYTPSIVQDLHARIGGRLTIRFQNEPGDLLALAMGKTIPGFAFFFPPFEGAFVIVVNVQVLINFAPVPSGVHVFSVPIPDDPVLIGGTLKFQAFAAGNLLAGEGSISNALAVTFQP